MGIIGNQEIKQGIRVSLGSDYIVDVRNGNNAFFII